MPEQPAPPSPPPAEPTRRKKKDQVDPLEITPDNSLICGQYIKPPFNILEPQPHEEENNISMELNQRGTMLVDTLKSFSVPTTIVNISRDLPLQDMSFSLHQVLKLARSLTLPTILL